MLCISKNENFAEVHTLNGKDKEKIEKNHNGENQSDGAEKHGGDENGTDESFEEKKEKAREVKLSYTRS